MEFTGVYSLHALCLPVHCTTHPVLLEFTGGLKPPVGCGAGKTLACREEGARTQYRKVPFYREKRVHGNVQKRCTQDTRRRVTSLQQAPDADHYQ